MFVKLLLMEDFKASIEVSVPTNDMMPKEMMTIVRIVRNNWLRIARSDILIFSLKTEAIVEYRTTKLVN